MKKRLIAILAVPILALSLSACSSSSKSSGSSTASKGPINIGYVDALSGPTAAYGQPALAAATWVFNKANAAGGIDGRKIKLIQGDDQCDAETGVAAVRKIEPSVLAVLGLTCSASAAAVQSSIVPAKKLPTISLSGGGHSSESSSNKAFQPTMYFLSATYDQGVSMVNFAINQLKGKRIAIIHSTDLYGQEGLEGVQAALKASGQSLVANESVDSATVSDTSAQVLKIKAAKPDVTLMFLYPTPGQAFLRQSNEQQVSGARVASASLIGPQLFQALPQAALNSAYFSTVNRDVTNGPILGKIAAAVKAASPKLAFNSLWASGAAAAEILVHAMKQVGPDVDRASLVKALDNLGGFQSTVLAGPFNVSSTDHNAAFGLMFFQVKNGVETRSVNGYWSSKIGATTPTASPKPTSPLPGYGG
jgi:branched-chain amino acid transport system substrate-binding protein